MYPITVYHSLGCNFGDGSGLKYGLGSCSEPVVAGGRLAFGRSHILAPPKRVFGREILSVVRRSRKAWFVPFKTCTGISMVFKS